MSVETSVDMKNYKVILRTHQGVVASEKKWSSTKIEGSGGGGYIAQGQGHISDVKISSSVTDHQEIHILLPEAREIAFRLANANVMLREGQPVSVCQAQIDGGDVPVVAAIHNHATDVTTYFDEQIRVLYRASLLPVTALVLAIAAVLYAFAGSKFNPFFHVRFFTLSRLNLLGLFLVVALALAFALPAWRAMRKEGLMNSRLANAIKDAIRTMKQSHPQQK